ncbi:MAG: TonB-dependent receptor, partial [Acidobacteriaceae bacterium]|nr:TonB-dependent receptor [Acidobacteriaceae bacterium]
FHNQLNNLIDNATLLTTPNFILQKRENFPSALSRGVEANVMHRWQHWIAQAGYLYADARLATGQRIPQVPKQQGTAQISFNAKGTTFSGGIRPIGLVFEDDLNHYLLPGYVTLQFSAQQRLTGKLSAVAAINNLLNRTYLVGLTPSPTIGAPLLWQVGLRWSGSIK